MLLYLRSSAAGRFILDSVRLNSDRTVRVHIQLYSHSSWQSTEITSAAPTCSQSVIHVCIEHWVDVLIYQHRQ